MREEELMEERRQGRLIDIEALDKKSLEESERFKEYVAKSLAARLDRLECAHEFRINALLFGYSIPAMFGGVDSGRHR